MSEIKHVLKEQLEREKNSAMKQLTTSNLDAMYKLQRHYAIWKRWSMET